MYKVYKDDQHVFSTPDSIEVLRYIHNHQSFSLTYALRWGGWKIIKDDREINPKFI